MGDSSLARARLRLLIVGLQFVSVHAATSLTMAPGAALEQLLYLQEEAAAATTRTTTAAAAATAGPSEHVQNMDEARRLAQELRNLQEKIAAGAAQRRAVQSGAGVRLKLKVCPQTPPIPSLRAARLHRVVTQLGFSLLSVSSNYRRWTVVPSQMRSPPTRTATTKRTTRRRGNSAWGTLQVGTFTDTTTCRC